MGALHRGHLDLVRQAKAECDKVVCSIFVNPLQFNGPADLAKYPRTPQEDTRMLTELGCDALFSPTKDDLFHDFTPTKYDLGKLDAHWEGPSRPGHFQGVVNVVERLFFHVRPDLAYFGEKDRQQLMIVQHVGAALRWPETIVSCPTIRDEDGLALSSRNTRLNEEEREQALVINRALRSVQHVAFKVPFVIAEGRGKELMSDVLGTKVDYFAIAHPVTLEPLREWGDLDSAIALAAARVGPVRLIDNVTLTRERI